MPLKTEAKESPPNAPVVTTPSITPDSTPVASDPTVAKVGDLTLTQSQMLRPLYEAYGLNVLFKLCQLQIVEAEAKKRGLEVVAADLDRELELTMQQMVPDAEPADYPELLQQFRDSQHISKPEFDLVMRINAHLRKIAEPQINAQFTEDQLQEAFNVLYGETVKVRHIQLSNLQEVAEASRRLAAGEKFEKVALSMSRNQLTAPLGGEMPVFSRATTKIPEGFKTAAFLLNVGEISEPVQSDESYHLIQLEARFAPKAVKFEDVREAIKATLTQRLLEQAVYKLKETVRQQAEQGLVILDPTLKRAFEMEKQRALDAKVSEEKHRGEHAKRRKPAPAATTPASPEPTTQAAPGIEQRVEPVSPDAPTDAITPPAPAMPPTPPATQEDLRPPATPPAE